MASRYYRVISDDHRTHVCYSKQEAYSYGCKQFGYDMTWKIMKVDSVAGTNQEVPMLRFKSEQQLAQLCELLRWANDHQNEKGWHIYADQVYSDIYNAINKIVLEETGVDIRYGRGVNWGGHENALEDLRAYTEHRKEEEEYNSMADAEFEMDE